MARSSLRLQGKQQASSHAELSCLTASDASSTQIAVGTKREHDEAFYDSDESEDSHDEKRNKATYSGRKRATGTRKGAPAAKQDGESSRIVRKVAADKRFKKIRGKLGLLDKLVTDVPMEVVFEIFSHLRPLDILRLARTSKALRDILMSKSSESIWRAARANVEGLPPLPYDLNEPQYARLMFDPFCYNCTSKTRCENVSWEYRMRCCTKCQPDVFKTESYVLDPDRAGTYLDFRQIQGMLPVYRVREGHSRKSQIELYISSIVKQYVSEYQATANDDEKRAQWKAQRERDCKSVREHSLLCADWYKTGLQCRTDELKAARVRRREELHEIGLAEEARKIMNKSWKDSFSGHKLVNQPTKLTDRSWQHIKEPLIAFLEQHKAERLAKQRSWALMSRYNLLDTMYAAFCRQGDRIQTPLPSLGDIMASELFDRVIWCTPFDKSVEKEDFGRIFEESLPVFIDEWREAREKELLHLLRQELPSAMPSDLHLATCVFEAKSQSYSWDKERLWYPHMFYRRHEHRFERRPEALAQYQPKYVDRAIYDPFRKKEVYPWSPQSINLKYSSKNSQVIKTVLEGCGLDPATATIKELWKADPVMECKSKCKNLQEFRWSAMFEHADHEIAVISFTTHKKP